MAEAAGSTPIHPRLPDEIAIWEILVRLPPRTLLRCRPVCREWRRATSTQEFLLAHHTRQPTLPLLNIYNFIDDDIESVSISCFDRRAGLAADDQLQPVARLSQAPLRMVASCDGMILLSMDHDYLVLCNPTTRDYSRVHMLAGFVPLGMYSHIPTSEYRLLLYKVSFSLSPDVQGDCYVFVLGSDQPPRHIGFPDVQQMILAPYVLFHDALHWYRQYHESATNKILVFDTIAESFRYMRSPAVGGCANMFEMDGVLGMSRFNSGAATIDIWMIQNYVSGVWAIKYRLKLPVLELTEKFGSLNKQRGLVACFWDGDLQVLMKFGNWLLQVDAGGKLVASFDCKLVAYTRLCLKESLVRHTFLPTLERFVVNASPFI